MTFSVLVEYIFDTYTRQNIIELAIEKILFVRSDIGVLVTPVYACALIYKNHLYYLYDCFGNNEVGLGEGMSLFDLFETNFLLFLIPGLVNVYIAETRANQLFLI